MYRSERTKRFEELFHLIVSSNFKMAYLRNKGKATTAEYHALRKQRKEAERELKEMRRYL